MSAVIRGDHAAFSFKAASAAAGFHLLPSLLSVILLPVEVLVAVATASPNVGMFQPPADPAGAGTAYAAALKQLCAGV